MSDDIETKTFTVVVGVDYSELGALALTEAVAAGRERGRSHLHVLHTIQAVPEVTPASGMAHTANVYELRAKGSADLETYLESVLGKSEVPDRNELTITTHFEFAEPAHALAQLASDVTADLVVVGTHGRQGLERLLLGSVAEATVRRSPCSVLVVRPTGTLAEDGPRIEPPCPDCVEVRRTSGGSQFWCERHSERRGRPHTYHFAPVRSAHQSSLLIRTPR